MNLIRRFSPIFLVLFTFPLTAYAYIDPGTGAMIVQAFFAFIVSVIFYLKNPSELLALLKKLINKIFR